MQTRKQALKKTTEKMDTAVKMQIDLMIQAAIRKAVKREAAAIKRVSDSFEEIGLLMFNGKKSLPAGSELWKKLSRAEAIAHAEWVELQPEKKD